MDAVDVDADKGCDNEDSNGHEGKDSDETLVQSRRNNSTYHAEHKKEGKHRAT